MTEQTAPRSLVPHAAAGERAGFAGDEFLDFAKGELLPALRS